MNIEKDLIVKNNKNNYGLANLSKTQRFTNIPTRTLLRCWWYWYDLPIKKAQKTEQLEWRLSQFRITSDSQKKGHHRRPPSQSLSNFQTRLIEYHLRINLPLRLTMVRIQRNSNYSQPRSAQAYTLTYHLRGCLNGQDTYNGSLKNSKKGCGEGAI